MMENLREEGDLRDSIELREEGESRDSIEFSRYQVDKWFKKHEGETYRSTPLPYLSHNQKADRVTWVRE